MKNVCVCAAALLTVAGLARGQDDAITPGADDAWPDIVHEHAETTVLVRLRPGVEAGEADALFAKAGGEAVHRYHLVPGLVKLRITVTPEQALYTLRSFPQLVQYAQPDYLVRTMEAPDDPNYNLTYGMHNVGQTIQGQVGIAGADINAEEAWDRWTGDENFVIAVIDAGTNWNHADLIDNIWTNPDEIPNNGIDDDNNGYVDDIHGWDFYSDDNDTNNGAYHGTHVSGTIAGRGDNGIGVAGVMWRAKIMPLRFINGTGSTSDAIRAIEYAVDKDVRVSNNSWGGGPFDQALKDAIESAADLSSHIFVAAAGNSGAGTASYPAAYTSENIIAVAATDNRDQLASFSQYNAVQVDLGAPGVNVYSCLNTGGYTYESGTSMATPHTSGCVALLTSYTPTWSWQEIKAHILGTVRPVASLSGRTVTGGVVDIGEAISTANGVRISPISIPDAVEPGAPVEIRFATVEQGDTMLGTPQVYTRVNGGAFSAADATDAGGGEWTYQLSVANCDENVEYYIEVVGAATGSSTYPGDGAAGPVDTITGHYVVEVEDSFETDTGWTVSAGAGGAPTTGAWERGTPQLTDAQPDGAHTGNNAWVTGAAAGSGVGSFDVDNGTTVLTSPAYDLAASPDAVVSYWRWFNNSAGARPDEDALLVEISNDNGASWTTLEQVGPSGAGTGGGWNFASFEIASVVAPTSTVRFRFTTEDLPGLGSIVEAVIDDFVISSLVCDGGCAADLTGEGDVNTNDFFLFLSLYQAQDPRADFEPGNGINTNDFFAFLAAYQAGC